MAGGVTLHCGRCKWTAVVRLVLLCLCELAMSLPVSTNACTWRSSLSPTMTYKQVIELTPSCLQGTLEWYYPQGELRLVADPEGLDTPAYQLCLRMGRAVATDDKNIPVTADLVDITHTAEDEREKHTLIPGSEQCVTTSGASSPVTLLAPTPVLYLYELHYTIQPT